jgi:hypothetical protein
MATSNDIDNSLGDIATAIQQSTAALGTLEAAIDDLTAALKAAGGAAALTSIQQSRSLAQVAFVQDSQWRGVTAESIQQQAEEDAALTPVS